MDRAINAGSERVFVCILGILEALGAFFIIVGAWRLCSGVTAIHVWCGTFLLVIGILLVFAVMDAAPKR